MTRMELLDWAERGIKVRLKDLVACRHQAGTKEYDAAIREAQAALGEVTLMQGDLACAGKGDRQVQFD